MSDPISELSRLVLAAASELTRDLQETVDPLVRRSDRADLQADLALGLARKLKKQPREVAELIKSKLPENDLIESIEIAGPGFLNVTLKSKWLGQAANEALADARLGVPTAKTPEKVIVDYSAPNVAKEMHVGHLRSTIIGDSIARVLEFRGHEVIRQNHIGDWGTPFGMLIEHMLDLGAENAEKEIGVGDLDGFYKAGRTKFDSDEAFAERSRARVVKLQGGDAESLKWWRLLVDLSQKYFTSIYTKLGVTLTAKDTCGESFYNDRLAPLAAELEKSGAATISEGALCTFPKGFLTKEKQPLPLIVRKTDGGFGYAATDLAAIRYRLNDLHGTRLLYVVGAPQAQHFAMFFETARELGWITPPARAEHVQFGSILGPDKKMFKSRSGGTVRLVELIDSAIEKAMVVVSEKAPDLEPAEKERVARMVGTGAIKYADLSSDRIKDYIFDLDRMVSFDGNTAGYLQYAHARVRSIFRKAGEGPIGPIVIAEPAERALALSLLGFAAAVEAVETTLEPHRLAGALYAMAMAFSTFYEQCPILKSEGEVRASRLALADLTAKTIAKGLDLLGIEVPERM